MRYLEYYFKTPSFWSACEDASRGSTGRNQIKRTTFLAIEVPLPSLAEQRRIVERLDSLSDKHATLERSVVAAIEMRRALQSAMLAGLFGDPQAAAPHIASTTRWRPLDECVRDVADGPHVTPAYVETGIPFITVRNITSGRVVFGDHKHITESDHKAFQQRARAERGDVLISKDGTIGVPCLVDTDREFSFFVSVALIKPKRDMLDGEYLLWALRCPSVQRQIEENSRGDMIRHLVLGEIRKLLIPVPPLAEQRRMVARCREMDSRFAEIDRQRAEMQTKVEALMPSSLSRAFTRLS